MATLRDAIGGPTRTLSRGKRFPRFAFRLFDGDKNIRTINYSIKSSNIYGPGGRAESLSPPVAPTSRMQPTGFGRVVFSTVYLCGQGIFQSARNKNNNNNREESVGGERPRRACVALNNSHTRREFRNSRA